MEKIFDNSIVSVALQLDTRRALKNGKYPVVVSIRFKRNRRRYNTKVYLLEKEWEQMNSKNLRDIRLKEILITLKKQESRAVSVVEQIYESFSFAAFDMIYLGVKAKPVKSKQDVYAALEKKKNELYDQQRFGTSKIYGDTLNSLKSFSPKLDFSDVTVDFLKKYETYLLVKKKFSPTTLSIYLRCLKAVMNAAIGEGIIPQSIYPFGKEKNKKYETPSAMKSKKALTDSDIRKIIDYEPKQECDARGRDMWLFTYYCNGMNMADILRLQYKNISGNFFSFYREKTKRTRKDQLPIQVYITPQIQAIFDRWGNPDKKPDSYIFNVIDWGQDPEKVYKDLNQVVHVVNNRMKHIGKELGIEATLTTYAARHSFGTTLMRKGVSTAYISKSYGHASFATTNHYLGEFTDEQKMDYSLLLTQV